jgi:hypothetical protein
MSILFHPCASCARHIKRTESACPFCGARASPGAIAPRVTARLALVAIAATAAGCMVEPIATPVYGVPGEPFDGGKDSSVQDGGSDAAPDGNASDAGTDAPAADAAPDSSSDATTD